VKRLILLLTISFLLWKTPTAPAQFDQAGVAKFRTPIAAPDFQLKELGGGEISLKEFRGKVVILNFYTTW